MEPIDTSFTPPLQTATPPSMSMADARGRLDVFIRLIVLVAFAFMGSIYIHNAWTKIHVSVNSGANNHLALSQGLSIAAVGLYTLMIALLYALRYRPLNASAGLWPNMAALFGGFLPFAFLLCDQPNDTPLDLQLTACLLILIGNMLAAYILTHLSRSFSILPEARKLITTGPYQYVRHPLYVAEAMAIVGVFLTFLSWPAALIVIAQLGFQLVRMHYEENVLRSTFPDYATYAQHTARIIPKIY